MSEFKSEFALHAYATFFEPKLVKLSVDAIFFEPKLFTFGVYASCPRAKFVKFSVLIC